MVKIKIDDNQYQIKTSWRECDYETFAKIQTGNIFEKITYLSDINIDQLGKFTAGQLSWLLDMVKFVDDLPNEYEDIGLHWDVGDCTYGQMEESKQAFQKNDNTWLAMVDVVKIYCHVDIGPMGCLKGLGYANYFFEQFNSFFETFAGLNDYEPEEAEIMAGVNQLSRFGFYPTMMALARKMSMKYDEVLNMSAREVYMTLLVDKETADYEKRLYDYRKLQNEA